MTWRWLKRWLRHKRRKSLNLYKKVSPTSGRCYEGERMTTLEKLPNVYIKEYGYLPVILVNAATVIEKNIKTRGLFQRKGDESKIMPSLMKASSKDKLKNSNVHDAVEAMTEFLVGMEDTFLPDQVVDALTKVSEEDCTSQYVFVLREFRNASPYSFSILHFVMQLLKKVSKYSLHNGMNVHKLATVFVLDVIRPMEEENSNEVTGPMSQSALRLPFLITAIENLIQNVDIFKMVCFLERAVAPLEEFEKWTSEKWNNPEDISAVQTGLVHPEIGSCSTDEALSSPDVNITTIPNEIRETPKMCFVTEGNSSILKDILHDPDDAMPSNTIQSADAPTTAPSKSKERKKPRAAPSNKSTVKRRKPARIVQTQTIPCKKHSVFERSKTSKTSTKSCKQKCSRTGKKIHSSQKDRELQSIGPFSDYTMFQFDEDMLPLSKKPSFTDNLSSASKVTRRPRMPAPQYPAPKLHEDLAVLDDLPGGNNLDGFDILTNDHVESSDSRKEPLTSRGVVVLEMTPSHKIRIKFNTQELTSLTPETCIKLSDLHNTLTDTGHFRNSNVYSCTELDISSGLKVSVDSTKGEDLQLSSDSNDEGPSVMKVSEIKHGENGNILRSVLEFSRNMMCSARRSNEGCDSGRHDPTHTVAGCCKYMPDASQATVSGCANVMKDNTQATIADCDNGIKKYAQATVADCDNGTNESIQSTAAGCDDVSSFQQNNTTTREVGTEWPGYQDDQIDELGLSTNEAGIQTEVPHVAITVTVRFKPIRMAPRLRNQWQRSRIRRPAEEIQSQNEPSDTRTLTHRVTVSNLLADILVLCFIIFFGCLFMHVLYHGNNAHD